MPSPAPTQVFTALDDSSTVIPPDTQGAVGLNHTLTTLNDNYRIQDKASGAILSTVTINAFWAATGASGVFDPKTAFDPYNNRFIVSAVSGARSASSSVLVGVSQTGDPTGGWFLFRFVACTIGCGATGSEWWADYPGLGFNRNWVAVTANMFTTSTSVFQESRAWVVNYSSLRSGTASPNVFTALSDFTIIPAATYSSTEDTLYAVTHVSSAGASYRLNTITGTPSAPVYTQGALRVHALVSAWTQANALGTDAAPQAPEPGTGLIHGVDEGDSRIMNAVFRNGSIWYTQTVGLPAGVPTHTAAQWIRLSTAGTDLDAGRVDDPTATSSNGGKWYTYPTIAVNANNDALIGFSQLSSAQYPTAAYAFRAATDAAGTTRDVATYQNGVDFYYKTFSGTRNRWGDYSTTQVDPADDRSFWTLQQSSKTRLGSGNGSGRWTTTWAKVALSAPLRRPAGDFDGDGRSDVAVFRPSTGVWWIRSASGSVTSPTWGGGADVPVPRDYDGDGPIDIAVFRPSTGVWYIRNSATGTLTSFTWGGGGDVAVPADYDGDRRADVAVFRPSTGVWYIRNSSTSTLTSLVWGGVGDVTVPGDYDGDSLADIAVFRPSTGIWYIRNSATGTLTSLVWGGVGDLTVPGDYDGDRLADIAVFRPSTGIWYIRNSATGTLTSLAWGGGADVPVPSDYDGDGLTDIAVFRPSTGIWYIRNSATATLTSIGWGNSLDVPINSLP